MWNSNHVKFYDNVIDALYYGVQAVRAFKSRKVEVHAMDNIEIYNNIFMTLMVLESGFSTMIPLLLPKNRGKTSIFITILSTIQALILQLPGQGAL